jgi:hypothetical protein
MIFRAIERENRAVVMAEGVVVTVQIADCGESNGENLASAQMIADTLTVTHCDYLWGLGPGMSLSPIEPMVWLEIKKQPTAFDGATLDQAIAKAAARIRGEA